MMRRTVFNGGSGRMARNTDDLRERWALRREDEGKIEMTDVISLLQERLGAVDAARTRNTQPVRYAYVGNCTPDAIAEPPQQMNIRVFRRGDPLPAGCVHYSETLGGLRSWFESETVKTGPNVWRWKGATR